MFVVRHRNWLAAMGALAWVLMAPAGPARANEPSILLIAVDPGALRNFVRDRLGRPAARSLRSALTEVSRPVPEVSALYGADWVVIDSLFPVLRVLREESGSDERLAEILEALNAEAPMRGWALVPGFGGCLTFSLSVQTQAGRTGVLSEAVASDIEGCASGDLSQVARDFYEF